MTHTITTNLSRPNLPPAGGRTYGEIQIEPSGGTGQADRQIALCLDVSGSMSGEKIDAVRQGAKWVIGLLGDRDYMSVVTFNSSPAVALEPLQMTSASKEQARDVVDDITAGGGTDIVGGVEEARRTLTDLPSGDGIARRILLLTDGQDTGDFERLAKETAAETISIMAAGIGDDYVEEVVRTLGEKSRGQWRHIEQPNEIRDFFDRTVEDASTVVAASPSLTLDVTAGTEVEEVYMGSPQIQPVDVEWHENTATLPIPDLAEGKPQTIVLRFTAPPREAGEEYLLANVRLDAGGAQQAAQFAVSYTTDEQKLRVNNEAVEVSFEGTKIRKEMIDANTKVEREEVQERITVFEETHPGMEQEVTRLRDDHQTIIQEGRKGKDSVSRVSDE